MKKICSKCKVELDTSLFYKDKSRKDGLRPECKNCSGCKERYNKNKDRISRLKKKYYIANKERIDKRNKEWNRKNRDKKSAYDRKYCEEHKKESQSYQKKYYKENKEKILKRGIDWKLSHRERFREWTRKYDAKRRQNPTRRIYENFSRRIRMGIEKNGDTTGNILEAVGYSIQELKEYLEKQFDENMNWDNYGSYWHIDHIRPVSSFTFNSYKDSDFKKCWSLSNLQPLEAKENIRKGNKLNYYKEKWQKRQLKS